ncbi:Sorting nexin mvp1 [Coemansia thaxteri]|uniref:Sorting nexin MVP1 n=1 Tax=Coemansia thaxteri TaxID=2663907 RepID=A0A9W8BM10_9FUNG|nr:Sorting nexin mvp1 [Coemansia thaxteri]KAJ2008566.1 Sorting nexin mvp1 [Coemansia thaxteri]KAJ2470057.1 Sorting nexin mvp1 [Coemansia sp. RSA 2322]KAJ2487184.1 Sorting nexin mvp1 [Coemansia sp. RSA 2320]
MSDLYDILDPWGPSNARTGAAGPAGTLAAGMLGGETPRECLDRIVLPPIYTIAYSATLKSGNGRITRDVLQSALGFSDLPRQTIGQIVLAADTGSDALTQRDFNLALAMTALAQKNMSPTIESVMFHRDDLPTPELDGIESLTAAANHGAGPSSAFATSAAADDPWLSAAKSSAAAGSAPPTTALAGMSIAESGAGGASQLAASGHSGAYAAKEQYAGSSSNNGVATSTVSGESGRADANSQQHVPRINMEAVQWQLDLEDVTIKESAERGGIVFKHTNYEVSTRSFSAMVVRRYNDFFWISSYLVKRYPYRMHPNIPPKGFPDNRVKGLTRFANAILRIPFLRRDALVIQFFSNTDEFSRVVKVGNLDMDAEEFDPKDEAAGVPESEIKQTYAAFEEYCGQITRDEEKYRTQITALEKISRYKQAIGDELDAYSDTLRVLNMPAEALQRNSKFHVLSRAKRLLRNNLNELSMSFSDASLLDKSQGEVMKTMSAEYLRRLYDVVISMKLMMDRVRLMDKGRDIQRIKERNDANLKVLSQLNGEVAGGSASAAGAVDRSGIERLERLVKEDTAELDKLEHEQQCISVRFYQELARYKCYESFLQTHYHRFVEEQIKHHTLALNAWKQALVTADDLPSNPLHFIS